MPPPPSPDREPRVAVVTDSTASLPAEVAERWGITVVPLQVVIGAHSYDDGVDPEAGPDRVAAALKQFLPVSTSRPSPALVLEAYERAAADGAQEIVSVHVSSQVSATYESALLAAKESPVPVHTVDSCQIGAATGFAALTAAEIAAEGGSGLAAAEAARRRSRDAVSLFYVDTLEYLRRGGRVGAASALLGSALAVKPILQVVEGRVAPLGKVRTAGRALARIEELAVEAAGDRAIDLAVCHLAAKDQAETLASSLGGRLEENLQGRQVQLTEVPAVLGAHVGPGLVGVAVVPR